MPLATLQQLSYAAGIFDGIAPHLLPESSLGDLVNGLLEDDGSVMKRGGATYKSSAAGAALTFLWEGRLAGGARTIAATANDFLQLAADDTTLNNIGGSGLAHPRRPAVVDGMLFVPSANQVLGGSRKTVDYSTGTVTVTNGSAVVGGAGTSWLANVDAGMLLRIGGGGGTGRVYAVKSVDSNTQLTLVSPYTGSTASGQAYTLAPIRTAPRSADAMAAVAGRLVTFEGDTLHFSALNDPFTFAADDTWRMPGGVTLLGGAALRGTLLVFTTGGVYALSQMAFDLTDDFGNPQQRLEHVNEDMVLWGPEGLATWRNAVVAPAADGCWLFDPAGGPELLTRSIPRLWRSYVKAGYKPGIAAVHRGHYWLPILSAVNNVIDVLVCRLDRPTQTELGVVYPWVKLRGFDAEVCAYQQRITTGSPPQPRLLAASRAATGRVLDCTAHLTPGDATAAADGSEIDWKAITRDHVTGRANRNLVRRLRVRYEMEADENAPEIDASIGSELRHPGVTWDNFLWGQALWSDAEDVGFSQLDGTAGPDEGDDPHTWTMGRTRHRVRYARFRLRSSAAVRKLVLRSHELFVRPSNKD